jgi:hypothetical protein
MASAQHHETRLDHRVHLVGTGVGLGGLGRQRLEAAVGVAPEPVVQRRAIDAVTSGDISDRRSGVEHLAHRLIALLNHR